jgi:putative membrane protein
VTPTVLLALGLSTLALVWLGPLASLAPHYFSAHMTMHMAVVAVAAPLIALGVAGGRLDPALRWPGVFKAIPASLVELIVVWAWHAPVLHAAARGSGAGLALEQGFFLAAGLLVWASVFGGERGRRAGRAGAGVVALLLTSMHMTLLGALLALAPRPLFAHSPGDPRIDVLAEQHLGGVIMLAIGGCVYMAGGLWLSARLLDDRPTSARAPRGMWT